MLIRPLVLSILFLSAGSSANSQTPEQLEAGKRAVIVRYVRAATDCLSQNIIASGSAMAEVANNRLLQAVQQVYPNCQSAVRMMIQKHDDMYGSGTGEPFFRAAYWNDLPRALMVRLKPELERRAALQAEEERQRAALAAEEERRLREARERQEQANREQTAERTRLMAQASEEHEKCLTNGLVEILPYTNENAETIATALLSRCSPLVKKMESLGIALYGLPRSEIEKLVETVVTQRRASVISQVVSIRAAVEQARRQQPPFGFKPDNGTTNAREKSF